MRVLDDWSDQDRLNYGKKIMVANHHLEETGLFTDEALIKLLNKHPNHLIDFQYVENDPKQPDQQVTIDFSGASGAEMMQVVKTDARVWINVREAMNTHPEYQKVYDQLLDELEAHTGKDKTRRHCRGGILISSKTAATPYHSDPTTTLLWHIRGHKKAWVYPVTDEFLPDDAYEKIVIGEVDEDMPFSYDMDKGALIAADLHGDEMVSWPHPSPHRVENRTFCVSMVMEFSSPESAFRNAGMYTNAWMRRRFNAQPKRWNETAMPIKLLKVAMGRVLKKIGTRKKFRRKDWVRYKLDMNKPGFIVPVAKWYERVH